MTDKDEDPGQILPALRAEFLTLPCAGRLIYDWTDHLRPPTWVKENAYNK